MITWTSLGNYLARPINAAAVTTSLKESDLLEISNATVLLVFSSDYNISEIGRRFLQRAVASCPLAIAVAGAGADQAFDDLLRQATDAADSRHIMTGHLDDASIDDVAESFLFGVIPAEERFDEWETLAVVVIEDANGLFERMTNAIRKWLDRQ